MSREVLLRGGEHGGSFLPTVGPQDRAVFWVGPALPGARAGPRGALPLGSSISEKMREQQVAPELGGPSGHSSSGPGPGSSSGQGWAGSRPDLPDFASPSTGSTECRLRARVLPLPPGGVHQTHWTSGEAEAPRTEGTQPVSPAHGKRPAKVCKLRADWPPRRSQVARGRALTVVCWGSVP